MSGEKEGEAGEALQIEVDSMAVGVENVILYSDKARISASESFAFWGWFPGSCLALGVASSASLLFVSQGEERRRRGKRWRVG